MIDRPSAATTSDELAATALVRKAVNGDLSAYGELYGIHLDRIYRYVYYRVRDEMTAQDIAQDVFVKAWKSIGDCRGKEDSFVPWLYRIAHNHLVDVFRKSNRNVPLVADYPQAGSIEQDVEDAVQWQQVLAGVGTLPEPQREIVLLKFVEGVDNKDIERITGKRQGAIRALQMRALAALRKQLHVEVGAHGK